MWRSARTVSARWVRIKNIQIRNIDNNVAWIYMENWYKLNFCDRTIIYETVLRLFCRV